jgi:hypothetical protein
MDRNAHRSQAGNYHPNRPANEKSASRHFSVAPSDSGCKCVMLLCHYCGYTTPHMPCGKTCPKCGMHSWERSVVSQRMFPDPEQTKPR